MPAGSGRDVTPRTAKTPTLVDRGTGYEEEHVEHHPCHQEVQYILRVKLPRLSNIFSKVNFTSTLSNSQSGHILSVDESVSDIVLHNFVRSIENSDCLAEIRIVSKCVGRCSMRMRKADNSNIVVFKFDLLYGMCILVL